MPKTKKRGGAKAHRKRVENRNNQIKSRIKKAEKIFNDAMMEQLEKMRESFSGETNIEDNVPVDTSETFQLNLGSPNLDSHL